MKEEEKIFAGYMFDPKTGAKKSSIKRMKHVGSIMFWMNMTRGRRRFSGSMLGKVGQVFYFSGSCSVLITVRILLLLGKFFCQFLI